jgi:hypothetical protein
VRARGHAPLEQVLTVEGNNFGRNTTLVVVTPTTHEEWVDHLRDLKRRGVRVVAVLLEASTFGKAPGSLGVMGSLAASGIPCYLVKNGDNLGEVLSQRQTVQI